MANGIKRPFKNKQEYTRILIKKILIVLIMYCVIVYYNVDMQGTDLYTTLAACGAGLLVFAVAFIWKEGVPMEDEDIEALMYEQEILNSPIKK